MSTLSFLRKHWFGISVKQGRNLRIMTPEQADAIKDGSVVAAICPRGDENKCVWASAATIREAVSLLKPKADEAFGIIAEHDWKLADFEIWQFNSDQEAKDIAPGPVYWSLLQRFGESHTIY